jgi:hypothetical protein
VAAAKPDGPPDYKKEAGMEKQGIPPPSRIPKPPVQISPPGPIDTLIENAGGKIF